MEERAVGRELNIRDMVAILLRRKWMILGISLACAAFFCAYSAFLITPMYRAAVSFYISNSSGADVRMLTSSDVAASEQLVDTYVYILSSNTVLDAVAQKSDLRVSGSALREMVTVSPIDGAGLCRIEVLSQEAQLSADAADAIARYAPAEVAKIVEGTSVKIVERAETPDAPVTPDVPRSTATGLLLGLLLSACFVLLRAALIGRVVMHSGAVR